MFTKSTLKFAIPAALLFAGVNAYAQEVTIGGGTETTWAEVVKYLNNLPSQDDLDAAVKEAQTAFNEVKDKPTIMATSQALLDAIKAAQEFNTAYNKWASTGGKTDPTAPTLYFAVDQNLITDQNTINISFSEPLDEEDTTPKTIKQLFTALSSDDRIQAVNVHLSDGEIVEVDTYTESTAQKTIPTVVANFLNLQTTKDKYQTEQDNPAYKTAEEALAAAKTAAAALENYKTITLNQDVEVTNAITNFSGEIFGNGHVFNVNGNGAVFTKFDGQMTNAAVNGKLTSGNVTGATLNNVAVWNGTNGTLYADGSSKTYSKLVELAYADREYIGVKNGKLASLGEDNANRVYSITVYNSATSKPTYYVTAQGGGYTNLGTNGSLTIADNVLVESATPDLTGVNVFYKGENETGTANEIVIKDGTNFFCPANIEATKLTYEREFGVGHATAYLPFALEAIPNAQILTYNEKAEVEDAFQFTFVDHAEANTPVLLNFKEKVTNLEFDNATIVPTATTTFDGAAGVYGLLKSTPFEDILNNKSNTVWGLSKNKFLYATDGVVFPAFRMVIVTDGPAPSTLSGAPRRIVILDEFGQEVDMSGVDNVAIDATELAVVGGVGELTITSSADLGAVAVYSIDGRVAANVNVVAGETTVDLAKGVYIVMGNKVLVK